MTGDGAAAAALTGFAAILALFTLLWLASLRLRDASIVDPFWGPAFVVAATAYAGAVGSLTPRGAILLVVLGIWAVRLGVHIYTRNRGHGEDPRYQVFRKQAGDSFWWVSFFRVFLLQSVLAWIISAPLFAAVRADAPLGALDVVGLVLWLAGFGIEALGDLQLRRFRADPASKGQVRACSARRATEPRLRASMSTRMQPLRLRSSVRMECESCGMSVVRGVSIRNRSPLRPAITFHRPRSIV